MCAFYPEGKCISHLQPCFLRSLFLINPGSLCPWINSIPLLDSVPVLSFLLWAVIDHLLKKNAPHVNNRLHQKHYVPWTVTTFPWKLQVCVFDLCRIYVRSWVTKHYLTHVCYLLCIYCVSNSSFVFTVKLGIKIIGNNSASVCYVCLLLAQADQSCQCASLFRHTLKLYGLYTSRLSPKCGPTYLRLCWYSLNVQNVSSDFVQFRVFVVKGTF